MAFRMTPDGWEPAWPKRKLGEGISVGVWNIGPGGGRFIPETREVLGLA